ncbi:MAG: hypothetical protein QM723_29880 [Myxococcaceae bacterium]
MVHALTPLLLVLNAAPVHVWAFHGAAPATSPDQLLKKYDPDVTLIDASPLYEVFNGAKSQFQDFSGFTAAAPAAWPKELTAVWNDAMKHCRDEAGPPPWKGAQALTVASSCSEQITSYLWQKYFERVKAERVIFIKADPKLLIASTFEPSEEVEHFIRLEGDSKDVGARLEEALGELKKPAQLQRQARVVVTELSGRVVGDPFKGEKLATAAVKAKKCDALPLSLAVSPNSTLSTALQDRWGNSTRGRGPGGSCTLELKLRGSLYDASLTCGSVTVKTDAPKKGGGDVLTEKLITGLAAQYCR